ncbi:MAG: hypothetical protein ACTS3F_13350 [Phycisphaerales bacterium]
MLEADAHRLADRLRRDFPEPPSPDDPAWRSTSATKTIDCVLSLRKPYERVVKPRVKRFAAEHPAIQSCQQLRAFIATHESPHAFMRDTLQLDSPGKAAMLIGVLDHLIDIQQRFDAPTEVDRLRAWARWARPGDYLLFDIPGFALAGFQYLRMLFGADTTKPDLHILNYLAEALDQPRAQSISQQVRAVCVLERACELLSVPTRRMDKAIWEQRTGGSLNE